MRWLLALAVFAALSGPDSAHALRCGTYLIDSGDTKAEVRARCGEPVDVAVRVESNTVHQAVPFATRGTAVRVNGARVNGARLNNGVAVASRSVTSVVETWTLNFGPQRFMVRIEFWDGIVRDIDTLGRGYSPEQLGTRAYDVRLGQSPSRVRSIWGEPSDVTSRVVRNAVTSVVVDGVAATRETATEVEVWLFNFGPRRFMRRVTFEDGRVVRIETLGRGF